MKAQHPDGAALDRLGDAVLLSTYLSEQADHLIGHFVDQARHDGASWSQIGTAMGVSKQAAQQRWVPRWDTDLATAAARFSRFTDRARNVLTYANRLAAGAGAPSIGADHVVLALYSEPDGLAAKALEQLGVDEQAMATAIGHSTALADGVAQLGFGEQDVTALDATLREALRLGHNYIGTEHLLLGVLATDLPVCTTLATLGVTTASTEPLIAALLTELLQAR